MIRLVGSAKRSFIFPGNIHEAMAFYEKMEGLFKYLPHIHLDKIYSDKEFRVLYRSTELSFYKIKLYCDLAVTVDHDNAIISVSNLRGKKLVRPKAGLHSSRGTANFVSTSKFVPIEENTRIYYHLNLQGELPKPLAFSFVPDKITNHIADSIANQRIYEIADGFIAGSLSDYKYINK